MASKRTPRGDATPVKQYNGQYMPRPYGPVEKAKRKKGKKRKYAA